MQSKAYEDAPSEPAHECCICAELDRQCAQTEQWWPKAKDLQTEKSHGPAGPGEQATADGLGIVLVPLLVMVLCGGYFPGV